MRLLSLLVLTLSFAVSSPVSAAASAAGGTSGKKKEGEVAPAPNQPATNACGCYEDASGQCHCVKKSKCGCPGTCEPAGCEDKRNKQLEKETAQELRKQQDEEKRRNAEASKKQAEYEEKESLKREKNLRGLRLIEEGSK